GTRAQPHPQALDAQDGASPRLVPGSEIVQYVDGRARGHLAAVGLGETAEDARHDTETRVGPHAERRGEAGLEDAPLAGDPLVEVAEETFVDVEIGVEGLEIAAERDAEQPRVRRVVDGAARLVVRARAVEAYVIARALQLELDAEGPLLGAAVAVEEVVEAPAPLRDHLEEKFARPRRRLRDALVEGGEDGVGAVTAAQLRQPRVGEPAGSHHGARVTLHEIGKARVAQEDPVCLLVEPALAHNANGRNEETLVVDLRGVRRDAAGAQAADVLIVAEGGGEADEPSLVEDGRGEDHVLVLLHGAVGEVWVVVPVDVAGAHALERIDLEDGREHAGPAPRDVTGHDARARVEHADEVVLLLLDEGRHRAPLHQELHIADGRPQTPPNDLQRNRINGLSLAPSGGEGRVRGRCHMRSSRRLCASSTRARNPGATSGVESLCSMMTGPSKLMPGAKAPRE